jgi:peptidoglycan/LPS O-acetylase OafA/YrhL
MSKVLQSTELNRHESPTRKPRLAGLDLCRGVAAFAVVILHADESMTAQPAGWSEILSLASFAVPFFLATSFYLIIQKLTTSHKPIAWQTRLMRLLIPYGFWSVLYLGLNILRLMLKHYPDPLHKALTDPFGLVFLGRAGFHLYFIPLLIIGTLIIIAMQPLIRRQSSLLTRGGWVIASILIYQSYRLFMLDGTAEISIFGDILALIGYAVRCLPYIAIALLLAHPDVQPKLFNFTATFTSLTVFVLLNLSSLPLVLQAAYEPLTGFSALVFALSISHQLKGNRLIAQMGQYSFGIYLMHLAVVEVCWSIIQRIGRTTDSIVVPLGVAVLGFTISWWITSQLIKQKGLAKIMFGVAS